MNDEEQEMDQQEEDDIIEINVGTRKKLPLPKFSNAVTMCLEKGESYTVWTPVSIYIGRILYVQEYLF